MAAGVSPDPLTLEEVMENARRKAPQFRTLLHDLIGALKVHNAQDK
jgi:purine nucleoside phosphorylase